MICIDLTHRENVFLAMILLTPEIAGSHSRADRGMSVVRLNVRVVVNNEVASISRIDHISYFICILGYQDTLFN